MSQKPLLLLLQKLRVNNTTAYLQASKYPCLSGYFVLFYIKTPISGCLYGQPIDKPGSVVDDHLSSLQIALQIKRLAVAHADHIPELPPCSQQGLPPPYVTIQCCELLPHSFHPYPAASRI